MNSTNPLQSFYRKPKFTITLPSRGRWYPPNTLTSADGKVEVYAMTAVDDTRFKTNEVLLSSVATYDLIRSCVPAIKDPEIIPTTDLDSLLLSIRRASYDDKLLLTVPVPNTSLTRSLEVSIEQVIESAPNASALWEEELIITNDDNESLTLTLRPVSIRGMFNTTQELMRQQELSMNISQSSKSTDEKIVQLDQQLKTLATTTVNMLADSISCIKTDSEVTFTNHGDIKKFIHQVDLAYVKAIQHHLDVQKKKLGFAPISCTSTPDERAAGAPETWDATIEFNITNFFEQS